MIAQPIALYQPTDAEITDALAPVRASWPTLASRSDKAADILLADGVRLEPTAWEVSNVVFWQVQSQSHAHGSYTIAGHSLHCCCPDKGQRLGDLTFCKHSIAVSAYLRILRDHFNLDVCARKIDLGMTHVGWLLAYAPGLGICTVERRENVYHFVDHASAVKYSLWLAKQELAAFEAAFSEPQLVPSY